METSTQLTWLSVSLIRWIAPRILTGIIHGIFKPGRRISGLIALSKWASRRLLTVTWWCRHFLIMSVVSCSENRCQAKGSVDPVRFDPVVSQSRRFADSLWLRFSCQSLHKGPNTPLQCFVVLGSFGMSAPRSLRIRANPPIPSHSQCETNNHSTSAFDPGGTRP